MNQTIRLLGIVYPSTASFLDGADHWALNNAHRVLGPDPDVAAWFQMHAADQWKNHRNGKEHFSWLKRRHDFPVYMQREYKSIPSSKKYPKDETDELWPLPSGPIYSDSFCYMIALAILQKYERIDLFNLHLWTNIEAFLEAPAVCLWLGVAAAKGVEITGTSRLLTPLSYGYEPRMPPLWCSRELASEILVDEDPPLKGVLRVWEEIKYKQYA